MTTVGVASGKVVGSGVRDGRWGWRLGRHVRVATGMTGVWVASGMAVLMRVRDSEQQEAP